MIHWTWHTESIKIIHGQFLRYADIVIGIDHELGGSIKTPMKTQEKKKNGMIYFLLLLIILLAVFALLGIRQQKSAMEDTVTAAKLEPKQVQNVRFGPDHVGEPLSSIQCQKDGNADDGIVDIVNQQLSQLPAYIQDAFIKDGWAVYVTDQNIGQTYYAGKYNQVMATTNYEEERILIESRLDAAYESPIHEIGHWFDFHVGLPSYTEEFAAVYRSESAAFIQTYGSDCVRDEMEFFAEGFWQYVINPERLRQVSPGLYQFINLEYCLSRVLRTWYEYGL